MNQQQQQSLKQSSLPTESKPKPKPVLTFQILAFRWARFAAEQTVDVVRNQPIAGQNGVNVQVVVSATVQEACWLFERYLQGRHEQAGWQMH